MRNDFAILILSHGRAGNVKTLHALEKANYSGKWYIVIDDQDDQEQQYYEEYGYEHVIKFCKTDVAEYTDCADNFDGMSAILWARNVSFKIARNLGLKYFMMNDDDFTGYNLKTTNVKRDKLSRAPLHIFDACIDTAIKFLDATDSYTVAFAQGGDFIGGIGSTGATHIIGRKCMNTFICRTDKPFKYFGRMNEDVSTYVRFAMTGKLMFTIYPVYCDQLQSQSLEGGMSEAYKDSGTYVKSFYSVMYAPSAVKIGTIQNGSCKNWRIHHSISWNNCMVRIIDEKYKKK